MCITVDKEANDDSDSPCGRSALGCRPGSRCVDGFCMPYSMGTSPRTCSSSSDCPLRAQCSHGLCASLYIGLDPRHCGIQSTTCDAGEICANGHCMNLGLGGGGNGTEVCEGEEEACGAGEACSEDGCLPMYVSVDVVRFWWMAFVLRG